MTTKTNATIAKHATKPGALDLNRRNLIGIVGSADNRRVLVRHSGGRIDTLTLADTLSPGKIIAISDDAVMIDTSSGARKLTMPKSAA